jgi:hypothetical protein
MSRIAGRIAANSIGAHIGIALSFVLASAITSIGLRAQEPTPAPPKPPAPTAFSGCVQKAPGSADTLVISTPNACATLKGAVSVDKLSGRQVDLKGVLTPKTPSAPASIDVTTVVSVGQSCSEVCSLKPPGTRGLHRPPANEVPGTEGGTPGAPEQPPQ